VPYWSLTLHQRRRRGNVAGHHGGHEDDGDHGKGHVEEEGARRGQGVHPKKGPESERMLDLNMG